MPRRPEIQGALAVPRGPHGRVHAKLTSGGEAVRLWYAVGHRRWRHRAEGRTGALIMSTSGGLKALLARACGPGDSPQEARAREAAFAELLRLVMIAIRAGMGRRLREHRESADVCQSVAKSFVDDFESGRLRFETEAQLAAYLQKVVRSKLVDLARHDGASKRGAGARPGEASVTDVSDRAAAGASAVLRGVEARERLLAQLSEVEQVLVRLRAQGLGWDQIAAALNKDPAALRQQFSRIQKRLGQGAVDLGE